MNVSEEKIPLQRMLDVARSQPDYNHAFPILEVILNHYMNSPDANEAVKLINEIKASFRKSGTRLTKSPASSKNIPKNTVVGRPKKKGTNITNAFFYTEKDSAVRLSLLFTALKALEWISPDTDQKLFIDLFGGGEMVCKRVIWTGNVNVLADMFRRMVNKRGLIQLPKGLSLWVMVNSHFWDKEKNNEFGTDRLRRTHPPVKEDLTITYLVNIIDTTHSIDSIRKMLETAIGDK